MPPNGGAGDSGKRCHEDTPSHPPAQVDAACAAWTFCTEPWRLIREIVEPFGPTDKDPSRIDFNEILHAEDPFAL
jgi:hypothetical protein